MNCEQQIKELEKEITDIAQKLLRRRFKWTPQELDFLVNASIGTPTIGIIFYGTRLHYINICIKELNRAKTTIFKSEERHNINSAIFWLNAFKESSIIFPKPKTKTKTK